MFINRQDAGEQLARTLDRYRGQNPLVLAIPRGGVEIGYQVATHLDADFSILISCKLPFPDNPEAGFGAIAEDGTTFIFPSHAAHLPPYLVDDIVQEQKAEIERRVEVLRGGQPLPPIAGRTVILVDDGIAMGSTMRASIAMLKNQAAARIAVAVPVTSERVKREIAATVDDVAVLATPPYFRAVAQVYRNWYDVSDSEVLAIMDRWRQERRTSPER